MESGTVTADELRTIRDLNYLARKALGHTGTLSQQLYQFNQDVLGNLSTYHGQEMTARMLHAMASTPDGKWGPHRQLLHKFADELGVSIPGDDFIFPAPAAPVVQPPAQDPAPKPTPTAPPSGDFAAQLRSALTAMGGEFNEEGTLQGFKFKGMGNPEGDFYAYVGSPDAGLRLFSGIREKIGGQWPSVDVNRNLPVIMGPVTERDGAISWDYDPPLLGSDPNPRPNKTFLMYFAGFIRGIGPRNWTNVGRFLDFGTFEAGRGIRFNYRRPGSHTPDFQVAHGYDADDQNPNFIRVDGRLRRVRVDGSGVLFAGEAIDESE